MNLAPEGVCPLSIENRNSDQVFLVEQQDDYIENFIKDKKGSVRFINDRKALEGLISDIKKSKIASKINGGADFLSMVFKEMKFKVANSAEFIISQNTNKQTCSDFSNSDIFYIKQDGIADVDFARLLEPFSNIATKYQPLIFIEANSSVSALKSVLDKCPDSIVFKDFGNRVIRSQFKAQGGIRETSEFISLYSSNCFSSISRTSEKQWEEQFLTGNNIVDMAKELLYLRSQLMTTERHYVLQKVKRLLESLDANEDRICRSDQYSEFLFIRALIKLNLLYCNENPVGTFDHAISVSAALDDPLLKAYTLRYANFISGNGYLKCHLLKKAEEIFLSYGIHDHSYYCKSNRLTTQFRMKGELSQDFSSLIQEVDEVCPNLHRKEDILYNAGLNFLLLGRHDLAYEYFLTAKNSGGRELISASARVGMHVTKYLDGQQVSYDEIIQTGNYISRNVSEKNIYHTSNLKLNLALLTQKTGEDSRDIFDMFGKVNVGGNYDVKDSRRSNDYMAARLGLYKGELPLQEGIKGEFITRYDFALPYFYIWS